MKRRCPFAAGNLLLCAQKSCQSMICNYFHFIETVCAHTTQSFICTRQTLLDRLFALGSCMWFSTWYNHVAPHKVCVLCGVCHELVVISTVQWVRIVRQRCSQSIQNFAHTQLWSSNYALKRKPQTQNQHDVFISKVMFIIDTVFHSMIAHLTARLQVDSMQVWHRN